MPWAVLLVLAQSFSDPEVVSADPDAPVGEIGWQSSLRAKIGLPVPLLELGRGPWLSVRLPSFLEVLNGPGNASLVPYQYLRARIQLEGRGIFELSPELSLAVALRVEHESDHPTTPNTWAGTVEYGFVAYNSLAALAFLRWQHRDNALTLGAVARLHVLTCTRDPEACGEGGGTRGDRSLEGAASLAYQRLLLVHSEWGLDAFAAVFVQYLAPTELIVEERRFTAKAGVGLSRAKLGRFYLYASFWLGTEGGYRRSQGDVTQGGFGFGWTY
jgi:hypothetical protein